MGFLGILIVMGLVAAVGLFGMKALPLYIQNSSVTAGLDSLIGVPNLGKKGKRGIRKRLDQQLYIDAVDQFKAKQLKIVKSKVSKVWIVTADYEAKTVLASNISIVIHFVKTVEIPR